MPKIALIVGITHYPGNVKNLQSCVNDAMAMKNVLKRNEDNTMNFHCEIMVSSQDDKFKSVTTANLKERIKNVLKKAEGTALFYFSGHGMIDEANGYLSTQDIHKGNKGLEMQWVMDAAGKALKSGRLHEIFIILDCCHSGKMGAESLEEGSVIKLSDGVSVLSAAGYDEHAYATKEHSHFTRFLIEGFEGAAADVVGRVNAASLYYYVEKSFSAMQQRPTFRASLSKLNTLRKAKGKLSELDLEEMVGFFDEDDFEFPLERQMEDTEKDHDPDKVKVFKKLQKLNQAGLVEPVGEDFMYFAAIHNKSCRLTPLGKAYWRMVKAGGVW